jgi:pimeloyl-ACP methyl ester carboxylesterase
MSFTNNLVASASVRSTGDTRRNCDTAVSSNTIYRVLTISRTSFTDNLGRRVGSVSITRTMVNRSTASVDHALEVRAQDASFVLDRLNVGEEASERVVMFGHSFGGAATATATAMLRDKRFRGGINLDGIMFGPVLDTSLGSTTRP